MIYLVSTSPQYVSICLPPVSTSPQYVSIYILCFNIDFVTQYRNIYYVYSLKRCYSVLKLSMGCFVPFRLALCTQSFDLQTSQRAYEEIVARLELVDRLFPFY